MEHGPLRSGPFERRGEAAFLIEVRLAIGHAKDATPVAIEEKKEPHAHTRRSGPTGTYERAIMSGSAARRWWQRAPAREKKTGWSFLGYCTDMGGSMPRWRRSGQKPVSGSVAIQVRAHDLVTVTV